MVLQVPGSTICRDMSCSSAKTAVTSVIRPAHQGYDVSAKPAQRLHHKLTFLLILLVFKQNSIMLVKMSLLNRKINVLELY